MLVGPSRIAACGVNHAINRVGADEVPRINRVAVKAERIAHQPHRIDGLYTAVKRACVRTAGTDAIYEMLVEFDALLIFGLSSVNLIRCAGPGGKAIAGCNRWGSEDAIVGDVVERAYRLWRAAGD